MIFDQNYYETIWGKGGIHRHDYCEQLANELIAKYGKVKILDIGAGCGFLVKRLRDKGADAWGIEISDYALENNCDKKHVIKGDIRSIPFEDNRFDVVHSKEVWGYFPESDIKQAWQECNRVGKIQVHTIDYNDDIPEHCYVVIKPKEWWDQKLRV